MKRLVVCMVVGALTALVLAGCSNGPSLKQGDCAVIGSDGSIHQISCNHPPQPQIYYVAQVTTGSCTVTADNEVTQNGDTLCLRQVYDTGSSAPPAPPSTAPAQAALPAGARYLGPITQQDIGDGYCTGVGREPILRHPNAYGWVCGHQGSTFYDVPVNLDQVCQYLYGTPTGPADRPAKDNFYAPDAVAHFRNYSDPNSWGCYGNPTPPP